jgi:hypothetical protein
VRMGRKYNIIAVLIFWAGAFLAFGWLTLLKATLAAIVLISWAFVSVGLSTWIGDRTFNRWDDD